MALAAMSSIGSAFAFSPAAKRNAITYYAEKTPTGFNWVTTQPGRGLSCNTYTAAPVACTIVTSTPPTNNELPADQTSTGHLYR